MRKNIASILMVLASVFYCISAVINFNNSTTRRELQEKLFYKYLERRNYYIRHVTDNPANYILMKEYEKIVNEINAEF